MLIDAHCHLEDPQFSDDLEGVLERAAQAGVTAMIVAGGDVATSRAAAELAERYDPVFAVVGLHPHYVTEADEANLQAIRSLAARRKVVGIGEIGLDFHYADAAPREMQERLFEVQLELAAELSLPVVVHDRDAHDSLLDILKRRGGRPRGLLHCFSGDLALAREAVELGYVISFAGNVTFRNAGALQEVARALPLEQMTVETDSPFLSPQRGARNEPANVARVAAKIAELKGIPPAAAAERTARNARSLFNLSQIE